ncbi:hypothetical protein ACFB49_07090 [Sphingomonas sp. DBB INV C78]|uniref:choice-of-anchor C family protein n=1 Tax=Sphingomonas sp. DBB INV C78 TaxID=3349434 RepID=UPI0036D42386
MRPIVTGLLATLLAAPAANAAVLINGSFELGDPQPATGSFNTLGVGNTDVTGWTVVSGSIDWINEYWQAQDGTHSIDLAGNEPGAIEQTIDTVAGQLYTVNYWLSGNPDGGDQAKQAIIAAIDGTTVVASSTITGLQGASRDDMQYLLNTFQFTAAGATTTLRFTSNAGEGAFGTALDAVSIAASGQNLVPEPSTWAMAMVGFGVVGAAMRRRHSRRPRQMA